MLQTLRGQRQGSNLSWTSERLDLVAALSAGNLLINRKSSVNHGVLISSVQLNAQSNITHVSQGGCDFGQNKNRLFVLDARENSEVNDLSFFSEPWCKNILFNKVFGFRMLYCVLTSPGERQPHAYRVGGSISAHESPRIDVSLGRDN